MVDAGDVCCYGVDLLAADGARDACEGSGGGLVGEEPVVGGQGAAVAGDGEEVVLVCGHSTVVDAVSARGDRLGELVHRGPDVDGDDLGFACAVGAGGEFGDLQVELAAGLHVGEHAPHGHELGHVLEAGDPLLGGEGAGDG